MSVSIRDETTPKIFLSLFYKAELYLDRHHPKGLYHEDYEAVAVMFASIPRYMDTLADNDSEEGGLRSLQVLNEIISGFDAVGRSYLLFEFS